MEYIINGITNIFFGSKNEDISNESTENNNKKQVTGYILNSPNSEKIYVLAKENEYCWRATFVDKDTEIITPNMPIRSVFCP